MSSIMRCRAIRQGSFGEPFFVRRVNARRLSEGGVRRVCGVIDEREPDDPAASLDVDADGS